MEKLNIKGDWSMSKIFQKLLNFSKSFLTKTVPSQLTWKTQTVATETYKVDNDITPELPKDVYTF